MHPSPIASIIANCPIPKARVPSARASGSLFRENISSGTFVVAPRDFNKGEQHGQNWHSKPVRFLMDPFARAYGFLDPVAVLARLACFAQQSEVGEPDRTASRRHAFPCRAGLVNTKAIQHNLDWVWPYWVERQFNPDDPSFVPRAFSFSHINLTHRNWTAVGRPDVPFYPIVDPRGLVTPLYDGWSLDFWFFPETGEAVSPRSFRISRQELLLGTNLSVRSRGTTPVVRPRERG